MTSSSGSGSTNITMQFDLDRNIDGAALDVQSQISASLRRLPSQLPAPPSFQKVNPSDSPILFLTLASTTVPLSKVQDYAEQVFSQQISQLPGVAQVRIFGAQRFAVRIDADPDAVSARGLTLTDVQTAVAAANSSAPVGTIQGARQAITLDAGGQLEHAADYAPLVVAWRNGAPVRLDEIATVRDSVEDEHVAAWFGDKRSIVLAIFRQSDANTVDVVDTIRARVPQYEAQLPPSIEVRVLNDRSVSIRESIADVQFTLFLSVVLVVLVIFVFLKSLWATLIPTLALPVSLIGTFAFMYGFGYSIDNISLLAITLSVGFVVDDAIVMLENISRHVEAGMRPFDAALKGSSEIAFHHPVDHGVARRGVHPRPPDGQRRRPGVPRVRRHDLRGDPRVRLRLAHPDADALRAAAPACRPSREARLVRPCRGRPDRRRDAGLRPRARRGAPLPADHGRRDDRHGRPDRRPVRRHPERLLPIEDTGFLQGSTEAAPDVSFEAMSERQRKVVDILMKDPAIDYLNSAVGFGGTNRGFLYVAMKPRDQRAPQTEVMARLRRATAAVPGFRTVFQPVQNLSFTGGRAARAQYQYSLQSTDLSNLYAKSPEMLDRLQKLPALRDVTSDLQIANPQFSVDLDREKAAAYGITADQVRTALFNAYGTRQISTIFTQAADYQVILEASAGFQDDPSALGRIYIRAQNGSGGVTAAGSAATSAAPGVSSAPIVPLNQVATIRSSVGPLTINRQTQQPSVTLSFNLAPGVSIGEATEAIRRAERDASLPSTIVTGFTGTAQLFQQALNGQGALLIAAVLVIYILLGVLYESFIHPITILSGLPSAGVGALLALQWFNMDLSVIAIIGILLLIGIVKKNAIMMVDFAIERRRDGVAALPAIREAAIVRFRPIMMTTLAALLGTLPIALGVGAGSELRQPLGVAIVGGLCVSQLLTLFITPVIYYYLDFVDSWFAGRSTAPEPAGVTAHGPLPEPAE